MGADDLQEPDPSARIRIQLSEKPATLYALDSYDLWHFEHLCLAQEETGRLLEREPALILPALDLYAHLYKPAPDIAQHQPNPICRVWVRYLRESAEVEAFRQRAALNEWATAAALGRHLARLWELLEEARQMVDQDALEERLLKLKEAHENGNERVLEEAQEELEEELDYLPPMTGLLLLESKRMEMELDEDMLDHLSPLANVWIEQTEDAFEDPMGSAPHEAGQDIMGVEQAAKDVARLMAQYNPHGTQSGTIQQIPMEQAIWLGQLLKNNPSITRIVELAGRMADTLKKKPPSGWCAKGNLETHSITIGGHLSRLLPTELGQLNHPVLRRAALARLVERRALEYELRGPRHMARGPIILVVDSSSSMEGGRIQFAKALMMALGLLCWEKKRPFVVLTFGSRGFLKETRVRAGAPFWPRVRRCLGMVFGGGTHFDTPLMRITEIATEKPWSKADAVFITDGEGEVSQEALEAIEKTKSRCDFRLVSVLMGPGDGLEEISDEQFEIDPGLLASDPMSARLGTVPLLNKLSGRI